MNFKDIKNMTKTMSMLRDMVNEENIDPMSPEFMSKMGLGDINDAIKNLTPQTEVKFVNNSKNQNPFYNYETDSGFDFYSDEDCVIEPRSWQVISTSMFFDIPIGFELQVRSKSGLASKKGLHVLNSPGTVDCGYTGEVKIILMNTTDKQVEVTKGMKIAQGVICPVMNGKFVNLSQVNAIEPKDRNANGFGSTGE